jgi:hypothetical protein
MKATLLQGAIPGAASDAPEFITNILRASADYSPIGKNLAETILLWNERSRCICGYQPEKAVGKANFSMLRNSEGVWDGKGQTIIETFSECPNGEGMSPGRRGTRHLGRSQVLAIPSVPLLDNAGGCVPQPDGCGT